MKKNKKEVSGNVNGIKYTVDESIVVRLQEKNIDVLKEIEEALRKFKETERNTNAS